jgi:hypothetical protein
MTEPSVSFAGNPTDPELRHIESGIARAISDAPTQSGQSAAVMPSA